MRLLVSVFVALIMMSTGGFAASRAGVKRKRNETGRDYSDRVYKRVRREIKTSGSSRRKKSCLKEIQDNWVCSVPPCDPLSYRAKIQDIELPVLGQRGPEDNLPPALSKPDQRRKHKRRIAEWLRLIFFARRRRRVTLLNKRIESSTSKYAFNINEAVRADYDSKRVDWKVTGVHEDTLTLESSNYKKSGIATKKATVSVEEVDWYNPGVLYFEGEDGKQEVHYFRVKGMNGDPLATMRMKPENGGFYALVDSHYNTWCPVTVTECHDDGSITVLSEYWKDEFHPSKTSFRWAVKGQEARYPNDHWQFVPIHDPKICQCEAKLETINEPFPLSPANKKGWHSDHGAFGFYFRCPECNENFQPNSTMVRCYVADKVPGLQFVYNKL